MHSERPSIGLRLAALAGLLFLHLPILIIFLYAFTTEERTYAFPPPGLTTEWFAVAWHRADIWPPLYLSLQVAALSTTLALILSLIHI
jgi:putative spermidine/putrescine transport system permease protein